MIEHAMQVLSEYRIWILGPIAFFALVALVGMVGEMFRDGIRELKDIKNSTLKIEDQK